MERVACHHCGRTFRIWRVESGRPVFCCTGCAVVNGIPVDAQGNFPVNATLVSALAAGFVYFNQLLFWVLTALLAGEGKADLAGKTAMVSLLAGAATWLVLTGWLLRASASRIGDWVVAGLALAIGIAGWAAGSLACFAAANGLLLGWSVRGLFKKKSTPKPDVTI